MYARLSFVVTVLAALSSVAAKEIVVTVGLNTTGNASAVFQPQRIVAGVGDFITFNFTEGNHTGASTFSSPCVPAHDTNATINGFDSGFRDTVNGTAPTILSVPILEENYQEVMWFFDYNTCGEGGVGAINNNESSYETLDGFARNAERLNGTGLSSSLSSTGTSTKTSSTSTSTSTSSSAERVVLLGSLSVVPLFLAIAL